MYLGSNFQFGTSKLVSRNWHQFYWMREKNQVDPSSGTRETICASFKKRLTLIDVCLGFHWNWANSANTTPTFMIFLNSMFSRCLTNHSGNSSSKKELLIFLPADYCVPPSEANIYSYTDHKCCVSSTYLTSMGGCKIKTMTLKKQYQTWQQTHKQNNSVLFSMISIQENIIL